MGMYPDQHLLIGVFRPGGVKMFSIHTDFPVSICFQPLIPADVESLGWQHQECFPVFFKEFSNRHLLFVMKFSGFLFMLKEQFLIVFFDLCEMWNRNKQVCTVIIHLALHVPLLPAGIGVAEPDSEMVVGTET